MNVIRENPHTTFKNTRKKRQKKNLRNNTINGEEAALGRFRHGKGAGAGVAPCHGTISSPQRSGFSGEGQTQKLPCGSKIKKLKR